MKKLFLSLPASYRLRTINIKTADGTKLPVCVIGRGKPVMILHAYGMDAREFLPFILPLVGQYAFHLPHFRGFGAAKTIRSTPFDFIQQYADDTNTVIEHICRSRHINALPVAAISMGALVMWAYFERFGTARVSRYLNIDQNPTIHNQPNWQGGVFGDRQPEIFELFHEVIDMTAPYAHIERFTHLPFAIKRRITDIEQFFSLLSVDRAHSKAFIRLLSHKNDQTLVFYDHSTWQHKMRCLQAYLAIEYDFRAIVESVTIPVTNLIGGRSTLYDPKWQQKITRMLPNARDVILPRSGHAVPMDEPVQFYSVLKEFLQD